MINRDVYYYILDVDNIILLFILRIHTPPRQDQERSFLITLKFGRDIAETGIS